MFGSGRGPTPPASQFGCGHPAGTSSSWLSKETTGQRPSACPSRKRAGGRVGSADQPEGEFCAEVCERAGCGFTLDLTALLVRAANLQLDFSRELEQYPLHRLQLVRLSSTSLLAIDRHTTVRCVDNNSPPSAETWDALGEVFALAGGPVATLIDWQREVPSAAALMNEAGRAQEIIDLNRRPPGQVSRSIQEETP